MALLSTQQVPIGGLAPSFSAAAAGGDTFQADGKSIIVVKNGGGGSVTVTGVVPGNLETGDAYPDKTYTVPATAERWIPADDVFRDPTTGVGSLTYSGVTSVTVGVFSL